MSHIIWVITGPMAMDHGWLDDYDSDYGLWTMDHMGQVTWRHGWPKPVGKDTGLEASLASPNLGHCDCACFPELAGKCARPNLNGQQRSICQVGSQWFNYWSGFRCLPNSNASQTPPQKAQMAPVPRLYWLYWLDSTVLNDSICSTLLQIGDGRMVCSGLGLVPLLRTNNN